MIKSPVDTAARSAERLVANLIVRKRKRSRYQVQRDWTARSHRSRITL